jgi:hypothetical protein
MEKRRIRRGFRLLPENAEERLILVQKAPLLEKAGYKVNLEKNGSITVVDLDMRANYEVALMELDIQKTLGLPLR